MKTSRTVLFSLLIMVGAWVTGCLDNSFNWDNFEINWQTEIIDLQIDPNPVEVGKTVTFTCIISDSTDPSFEFTWTIEPNHADTALVTSENHVTITAPDTAGRFQGNVTANNDEQGKVRAIQWFYYDVIEKQN